MGEFNVQRHPDEFTTLKVFRRVESGANHFMDAVRALTTHHLGSEFTGLVEVENHEDALSMGYPYASVMSAGELAMDLYSRSDVAESRPESRVNELKKRLRNGVPVPKSHIERFQSERNPRLPLLEELSMIEELEYPEVVREGKVRIPFNSITLTIEPFVKNGYFSLALNPHPMAVASKLTIDQCTHTAHRVGAESTRVAFPAERMAPHVVFMTIRDLPSERRDNAFLLYDALVKWLPIELTFGQIEIR